MRIRSIRLQDFRGFQDETISLDRPFTVLIGANGSGKSSVLDACAYAQWWILRSTLQAPISARIPRGADVRVGSDHAALTITLSSPSTQFPVPVLLRWENSVEVDDWTQVALDGTVQQLFPEGADLLVYYGAARTIEALAPVPGDRSTRRWDGAPRFEAHRDALHPSVLDVDRLIQWIRDRQDLENDIKVTQENLSYEDPVLATVRRAVSDVLPSVDRLRIQREPFHLTVRKAGVQLLFEQLSDGEQHLLALAGDLARRLALAAPPDVDPLAQEAVVLIDEIETHLHPSWQRRVAAALQRAFPCVQFIATTHSPQVISELPSDAVVLLDAFKVVAHGPTHGRDTNAILTETMKVPARPREELEALQEVGRLLDAGDLGTARAKLEQVAQTLSERDAEIVRYRTLLHVLEADL